MRKTFRQLTNRQDGSIAIETALVITLVLAPMLFYGVELYSYKTRSAELARDSYSVAMALAANPDDTRTDEDIIGTYRQTFPENTDLITVTSYCTCGSSLQSYTKTGAQSSCESSCPSSTKLVWKKVTVRRDYEAMINARLLGNKKLKASHLFRNS